MNAIINNSSYDGGKKMTKIMLVSAIALSLFNHRASAAYPTATCPDLAQGKFSFKPKNLVFDVKVTTPLASATFNAVTGSYNCIYGKAGESSTVAASATILSDFDYSTCSFNASSNVRGPKKIECKGETQNGCPLYCKRK